MNLINDPWIPVQRKSDAPDTMIAPWQLTETTDPIISLNAPRADFNGALMQFLIGLLQTCATPDNHDRWLDWLETPPDPKQLKTCFDQYAHAFELQGQQGIFMQDFEELNTEDRSIEKLLIDAPQENTIKENKDHFVKRKRIERLCPSCVAMSLFTLQLNAPSGGSGHRTSLRGGGPLTTLVILDENSELPNDLWRNLWLNVLEKQSMGALTGDQSISDDADIFPWLKETKTSEKNEQITPIDANPLQMYWGMPRRIRIQWQAENSDYCNLCGKTYNRMVTHYQTKNYGINYLTETWQHPLSPYREDNNRTLLPQHAQPGGLTYQHWLNMVEDGEKHLSAKVVKRYRELVEKWGEQFRLYAFGYDMDNMKARCWYETTFPLHKIPEELRIDFSKRIRTLTETADKVAECVRSGIKKAWFKRPGDVKGDSAFLKQCFYHHTESDFYQAAKELQEKLTDGTDREILQSWHRTLCKAAMCLFDYWATRGDFTQADPRRIAKAREKLRRQINDRQIRQQLQVSDNNREAA